MILALARPDPKKNLTTLVKAFGECRPLRELANLVSNKNLDTYFVGVFLSLLWIISFMFDIWLFSLYFADFSNGNS